MNTSVYAPFGIPSRFAGKSSSTARRRQRGRITASVLLWLCLPFLGMWSLPVLAVQAVTFALQTTFVAGDHPWSVTTGDFNGDGKTDLVTANLYSNTVSVRLGNGSGGFDAQSSFKVGNGPGSVATGDFNGDGKTDLVTANVWFPFGVSVLLGNGRGGFSAQTLFDVEGQPVSVKTADFNGDGNIDLVTANFDHTVSVLLGNGSGGFGAPTTFAVGYEPNSVIAADFNSDGNTDLVTANSDHTVSVLLGNGSGGFGAQTPFSVGSQGVATDVATADFNGDGKSDLVTAIRGEPYGKVAVLLGDGRGDFGAPTLFAVGFRTYSVVTADFNGDGNIDLVTANSWFNNMSVLLGNGNGGFSAQTTFDVGIRPQDVATADFNGDGKTDLATANAESNNVSVLLNTTTPRPLFTSLPDINSDGSPELAVVRYDIGLHKTSAQVKNTKTGALLKEIAFDGQFVPKSVITVPDLNGTGAAEIAVLGIRNSDQAVQVEIRDALSGIKLSAVPFSEDFPPIGLTLVRDSDCGENTCLVMLQQNSSVLRAQIKDALTGNQIRNIGFDPGYKGRGLTVIKSVNGNQSPELALLADNKTPGGADKVEIRDSKTGGLIHDISYSPGKKVRNLIKSPDLNDNGGNELVTLLPNDAQIVVVDAKTGLEINTIDTTLAAPYFLARVNDLIGGIRLVLLGQRAADGQIQAEVYDSLTGAVIRTLVFSKAGTTIGFSSIADINGNGTSDLRRVIKQQDTQKTLVEIRDGGTGVLINVINF